MIYSSDMIVVNNILHVGKENSSAVWDSDGK